MNLLEVVHRMVLHSDIGARNVAERVGKNYYVLLNELNPGNDKHKLGADLLVPLMSNCRSVEPIHHLAEQMGGVFIKMPEIADSEAARKTSMEAMSELGAMCRSFEHALEQKGPGGDHVTDEELELFDAQAQRMITSAVKMRAACREELERRKVWSPARDNPTGTED